jgi:cell division septum initiation protein DivIVA
MTTPIPLTQALTAVQSGTLAQAIADVFAERDRLRKENAILQEANRGLARQCEELRAALASANALIGSTAEECKGIVSQCEKECDRLRARAEAMRSALEIATDAGKGYVPADKARVIAEALLKSYEFISTAEKLYGREPAWIMAGGPSLIPQLDADLAIARELGLLESPQ